MSFRLRLSECVVPLNALQAGADVIFTGVSIDTRTLNPGDIYIAIVGERFDGHDFVAKAEEAGAAAVVTQSPVETALPTLTVENTITALGQLAQFWAQRFDLPTVAITGSNGKTTVKEILSTLLRQLGPVLATEGNLNNEIGVPLTLLRMREEHLYAVIEMGANHRGEIARLTQMVRPDVAVVNNVGKAHLEGFGGVDGIACGKSEIYAGVPSHGTAIINAEDAFASVMREASQHCHQIEYGLSASCTVQGVVGNSLQFRILGQLYSARWQLSGKHNGMNALAAIAAAHCLDVQPDNIIKGLESVRPVPGRLEKKPGVNGATLIDDSYNANPDSAEQAVRVLARYKGRRYLVLGDMAELGDEADSLHARVGAFAGRAGLDGLWTVGSLSSCARKAFSQAAQKKLSSSAMSGDSGGSSSAAPTALPGAHFNDQKSLLNDLKQHLADDVTVLIKGSRSARMERVVKGLMPVTGAARAVPQGQRL